MIDIERLRSLADKEKRDFLSSLGIYDLRGTARLIGVPSPTTKKREELIETSIKVLNGELSTNKSTKGRPCKTLDSIETLANIINEASSKNSFIDPDMKFEDFLRFEQEIPAFEYNDDETYTKKGVLREAKSTLYFVNGQDVVFIDESLRSKYNINVGDYVEILGTKIDDRRHYLASDIKKINGSQAKGYSRKELELKNILPSKTFEIDGKEILIGARNLQLLDNPLYLSYDALDCVRGLVKEGEFTVFLGISLTPEDMMVLNNQPNTFVFTTAYGRPNISEGFDKILDAISLTTRLSMLGYSVNFICADIHSVLTLLDKCFKTSGDSAHSLKSTVIVDKIVTLAGAYESGNSVTSLILCSQLVAGDEYIKSNVLKICRLIK